VAAPDPDPGAPAPQTTRKTGDDRGVSITETLPTDPEDDAPVYDRLRADIIAGIYAPGSALRFAEMQKRYGLGVSRLREALAQLAADRLVIREVNRGFRVPEISLANFDDIAAMRLQAGTRGVPHLRRERRRRVGRADRDRRPPSGPRRQTLRRRYRQRGSGRLGTLPPRVSRGADRRLRLAHDAAFLRCACTTISTATGG
jgi:hypothetical protein